MVRASILIALAQAAAGTVLPRQWNTLDACAMVATEAVQPSGKTFATLRPSIALDCLRSIEVDSRRDAALIDYLSPFLEELSTLGYLKNPPPGYLVPGIDLVGAMREMKAKLARGSYLNQHEFMIELHRVFRAASEGHLSYNPALLSVFEFSRGTALFSASSDGIQPPKVYASIDLARNGTGGFTPSEVVEIDGEPVQSVLSAASFFATDQDPDAKYNDLFNKGFTQAGDFVNSALEVRDNTTLKFANNTVRSFPNLAAFGQESFRAWNSISTGADVHNEFEIPNRTRAGMEQEKRHLQRSPLPRHPLAPRQAADDVVSSNGAGTVVEKDKYDTTWGIFLNGGTQYRDTCVLRVRTFDGGEDVGDSEQRAEMRRTVRSLVKKCKADGRTKLMVDFQGNGGGSFWAGLELYRNLFPKSEAFQALRWRATPALKHYSEASRGTEGFEELWEGLLTTKWTNFSSFDEFFGPDKAVKHDSLTNRGLMDGRTARDNSSFTLSGFDPADTQAPQEPPFKPEDVVIVSDGHCASTCAGIAGLMTREAGVRSIAFGGRPHEKPMQAIGGTRGGEVRSLEYLGQFAARPNMPEAPPGVKVHPIGPAPLLSAKRGIGSLNWYNEYPMDAPADAPPLQFVYEAAHCRRFFRAEHMFTPEAVWHDAADVAWRRAKCVKGSTINTDQTIPAKGGLENTPAYSDAVRFEAKYTGPGAVNNGAAPSGTPPAWRSGTGPGTPGSSGAKKDAAVSARASVVAVMAAAAGAAAMLCA